MFTPRPYQQQAIDKGVAYLTKYDKKYAAPSVIVLPTGAGKSIVIAKIVEPLDGEVLILQPSKEILEQNYAKLCACGVTGVGIWSASAGQKRKERVTYATIGSIMNSLDVFKNTKHIIIDECHGVAPEGGQYLQLFDYLGIEKVLGLTASPYRLKSYRDPFTEEPYSQVNMLMRTRPNFFKRIIHVTQISELVDAGYLSKLNYVVSENFDPNQLQLNSTGADYTQASLNKYMDGKFDVVGSVADTIVNAAQNGLKHRLAFVPAVHQAEKAARRLQGMGFNAAMVCGDTKKSTREAILENFQSGLIDTVVNVGVLTTGFDFPELDCVILGRPTMSLALYYQMGGRAFRIHPNKTGATIYDLCGNFSRFGALETLTTEWLQESKGYVTHNNGKVLTGVRIDKL